MPGVVQPKFTIKVKAWLASKARPIATVVDTVVLHATDGSGVDGSISWLRHEGNSYHYIIDRDGVIFKLVPISRAANHAGNSYGPREQWKKISTKQDSSSRFIAKTSVNPYTIGISFACWDSHGERLTELQWRAAEWLINELRADNPSLKYITCHKDVSPHRKTDPRDASEEDMRKIALATRLMVWRRAQ